MPTQSKKSHLTFQTAYTELEQIAKEFEQEEIDLEKSIPKLKRAAELSKFLKKRLGEIENQIEEIDLDEAE